MPPAAEDVAPQPKQSEPTPAPRDMGRLGDARLESVAVSVDELIIGRRLKFPIFDSEGILLLAEGSVVTSDIKKNLRSRHVSNLLLNKDDLKTATLRESTLAVPTTPAVAFDSDLTRQLDAIIDAGLLTVANKGPAVRDEVVFLGRRAYDQEQRQQLIKKHEQNGKALGSMMSEALHGDNQLDGQIVAGIAMNYLKELATDPDNVLTSTIDSFQQDDLAGRALETSLLAMAIGIEMKFDAENIKNLGTISMVHDWGMMRVPAVVRNADRVLTQVERLEIQKHPIYSLEILQRVTALPRVVPLVAYQIHERMNGKGYPRGRRGASIHPFARVIQVADTYVAMTSARPYRPPYMRYAAMESLVRQSRERDVDAEVVRALLSIQSLFPIGSIVALSDGSIARVLRRNAQYYTAPIVQRLQDHEGEPVDPLDLENIIDLNESNLDVSQALPTPGRNEVALNADLT